MKQSLFILLLVPSSLLQAQVYNDYIGAGHSNGITVTTSNNALLSDGIHTIDGLGLNTHLTEASRLLSQASFGADWETIESVATMGPENWINYQLSLPPMSYLDTTWMIWNHFVEEYVDYWGQEEIVGNPNIMPGFIYFRQAWWNNTMKGEDQLRQRVAFALSEILVISEKSQLEANGLGIADYYDMLYHNAFGNYRDILDSVTLHPAMGSYLSHLNNEKTDVINNIRPDQNYAREIMQLFTIGLDMLNEDGTLQLDGEGNALPTYDNTDIEELSKIFTGLGPAEYWNQWEDWSGIPVFWNDNLNTVPNINLFLPMQMFQQWHEPGPKYIVNGGVIPAGQTGMEDIEDALNHLFDHPNVAPFISIRLIQRLVKSNPTPEYVSRVAAVFNDNGEGVKGDLKAVIKAILLDPEARNCDWIDMNDSGKMREPLMEYTGFMRAFNAANESGKLWNLGLIWENLIHQSPMSAPSVFNFFQPSYSPPGPIENAGLVAPEFQTLTHSASINFVNLLYAWLVVDAGYMEASSQPNELIPGIPEFTYNNIAIEDRVFPDFSDEIALADDGAALMDRLDILLTAGNMSAATKTNIRNTISTMALFDNSVAARMAIFLTLLSPDYVIQK
jgi:uncharacterized protein (DUF1800 family)